MLYGSRCSSLLYSKSFLCVVTPGIGLPESCSMASQGFYWHNLHFEVSDTALGVATLGVGLPTSFPVVSRGSLALNMVSFGGVTICVGNLGVSFHRRVQWNLEAHVRYVWLLLPSRRLASAFQRPVRWHPQVHFSQYYVL
jgi:hypothetical protein